MKILITEKQYKRILKEQNGFVEIDPDYALAGYVGINSPTSAVLVPSGTTVNLYTTETEADDFKNFKSWRNTKWEWWIPNKSQLKEMLGLDRSSEPTVSKFKTPDGKLYLAKFGNYNWKDEYDNPRPDSWRFEGYFDINGKKYQPPKSPKPLIDHEWKIVMITVGAIIGTILCPECWLGIAIAAGTLEVAEEIRHGDKGEAALAAVFSLMTIIPWSKVVKFGKIDLDSLANKINKKIPLTQKEKDFLKALSEDEAYLLQLKNASDEINSVTDIVKVHKKTYVERYGQNKYDELLKEYINKEITKDEFINTLKSGQQPSKRTVLVTDYGSRFTKSEIDEIEKLTNEIPRNNYGDYNITMKTHKNPQGEKINIKVRSLDWWEQKTGSRKTPGSAWVDRNNEIYIIHDYLYSDDYLKHFLHHELAHIKDPYFESSRFIKGKDQYQYGQDMYRAYQEAIENGNTELANQLYPHARKYYLWNPAEITAIKQQIFGNLDQNINYYLKSGKMSKDQISKTLEDLQNFFRTYDRKYWTEDARTLLNYEFEQTQTIFSRLKERPTEYIKFISKLNQQIYDWKIKIREIK